METVVQILEAEKLAPIIYLPGEMQNCRLEVTIRPVDDTAGKDKMPVKINEAIMRKFQEAAKAGEAKDQLKRKLAEGTQFDFDAAKLINGSMTENDWQNLYALEKQAWPKAINEKAGNQNA